MRLIDWRSPSRWQAAMQAAEAYSAPRSVWKIVPSRRFTPRVAVAASKASQTSLASCRVPIDQPSRCREARSMTEARYSQPSSVGM